MNPYHNAPGPWPRLRHATLCGAALAIIVPACTEDAIVYPNRNLKAQSGEAGVVAAAGDGGNEGGGAGTGATVAPDAGGGDTGMAGASGAAGAGNGPGCGNGIVEAPEECDDGNTRSGDGCSSTCRSSCETCEAKVCSLSIYDIADASSGLGSEYDACYLLKGQVTKGPGAGADRVVLCRALVDCVRTEKCAQKTRDYAVDVRRCWCDVDFNASAAITICQNPLTFVPGKCAAEFQEASEGDVNDPNAVTAHLSATSTALGRGLRLLEGCDEKVCVEECMPEYFGDQTVATITQDITRAANPSGESELGDLTADAQRMVAGSDAALLSLAALCSEGPPTELLAFSATPNRAADADGRVLWSEALATQFCYRGGTFQQGTAYANTSAGGSVLKATLSGQQVYDALKAGLASEHPFLVSGLTYSWQEAATPALRTIVEVQKDGVPIDRSATLTVAMSDFLASTLTTVKGTNVTVVPNAVPITLFGQYLSQLPQPVSPPPLNRITRLGG